jgi:hypothetical protein
MVNKRTSRFHMGMQHKTRRGETMMISSTNWDTTQGEQPSRNWYSNYSLQTYDEMDPNYVLHASPSQREERSDKWAQALITTKKKVDQNEAIFNFLKHNSLIMNEWAVSGMGRIT